MYDTLQVAYVFVHAQQHYVVGMCCFDWDGDTCKGTPPPPLQCADTCPMAQPTAEVGNWCKRSRLVG